MKLFVYKSARETEATAQARQALERKYSRCLVPKAREADYVVVLGGDGTLLEAERWYTSQRGVKAAIIGLGYGTANNLMNKPMDLRMLVATADRIVLHPLNLRCLTGNGVIHSSLAFNEVVVHRCSPWNQACHLNVRIGTGKEQIRGTIGGDGLVIASRQGYSGYFKNAGGKFIDIWSANIGTQPICDLNATALSRVIPESKQIIVDVYDADKRPVIVNTDNNRAIQGILRCEVQVDKSISVPLMLHHQAPIMQLNRKMAQERSRCRH